jgi:hypothetical protein
VTGAIGFETQQRNWFSRLIRWFTASEWSHVFLVLPPDPVSGRREILEANVNGIYKTFLDKYHKPGVRYILFQPETTKARVDEALTACLKLVGRSYGFLQYLGYVPMILLRRLGLNVNNPISAGRVCSELALRYCQLLHLDERFDALDRDSVLPQELIDLIDGNPHFVLIDDQEGEVEL